MAKSAKQKLDIFLSEKIVTEKLETIIGDRFGRYSKYIIQDRALPDVRDGLKPVQRRILFAMNQLGMFSDKPFKKSARIVGEVIGKYHPHGDQSVYDALVRMSQLWKMGALLIDMHGNNGSIDNDPPAAMRYTEARLSMFAEMLLRDIDKKTVIFVPNFDDEEYEPVVLPAKFPNLLVNGAMGMATGYATNIPPHNLGEILQAVIYKIDHPNATIAELMSIVKGPDFPTGAIVEGIDGIQDAFLSGKGRVIIKSKVEIKESGLIITEIPYEVNKADLVRKIDDIRLKKKIDGIIEVRDESDREGLRIAVDIKKEIDSEVVYNYLLKNTDLSVAYNYNMVAIHNKSPQLMSLADILDAYILHQKEVVRNRSNFELIRAEKRKHIVEGFLKMVSVLDDVIALIRKSEGKKDAILKLYEHFDFSEMQADAIVSLQLYRLSSTDVKEMQSEAGILEKQISTLGRILHNEKELENVIKNEITQVIDTVPTPRRTQIQEEIQKVEIDETALIEHENVIVVISRGGYIKRSSLKSYQATNGQPGLKQNDQVLKKEEVNTKDTLLIFTNLGNYIVLPVFKISDMKWRDQGDYIGLTATLQDQEEVLDFLVIDDFSADKMVLLANEEGQIKQVALSEFQQIRLNKTYNAHPASKINTLVSVDLMEGFDTDIVLVTENGYVLKYPISEVPSQRLSAKGVKGINLRDDILVGAKYVSSIPKDELLMLTNRGAIKRESVLNIEQGHRPAKGKLFLKQVKTNPYRFRGIAAENIFRLREYLTIRIMTIDQPFELSASDLKPDRYEHGIPILERDIDPIGLIIEKNNGSEANRILYKLYQDQASGIITESLPEDDEDMLLELEKIIQTSEAEPEEPEDQDEDEVIIQQTLF
ncbi:MAG: DNA topoisomerase IV subunit A [Candidatus Izemoplasmatales bacterium]|nr:DNA topoisomerase IV subunit A [Candidatus Izemoplasmatales bacterium]MDD4354884.1 DNA topoisomerase IV subunit A [Candidatus Izemoplasmatales bacterium]MDD4987676.1 DNA topoisomerase IV subunit A [Candidatus Izemoplasmatales bacterium]